MTTRTPVPGARTSDGTARWATFESTATHGSLERKTRREKATQSVIVVPREQWYYWTADWQQGEAEAEADIRAGRLESFESMEDVIRALLSDD